MKSIADAITVRVTDELEFDHNPGCGVYLSKRGRGGKAITLSLSAPEFRALHRAMAAAEPFICDAEQKQE